jgi:EAL domain-containing protein (putative c-di-GMP-specific phosphodiesterase class I)/DNA-binding response OmpR family regulator
MPPESPRTSPLCLCVAEDAGLLEALRSALALAGWEVTARSDAGKALAACVAERPDLVLLDAELAGLKDVIAELAASVPERDVPAVAVGLPQACLQAVEGGATDWIETPVDPRLLAHRANAALRTARLKRRVAALEARLPAAEPAPEPGGPSACAAFQGRVDAALRNRHAARDHAAVLAISVQASEGPGAAPVSACIPVLDRRLRETLRARDTTLAQPGNMPASLTLLDGAEFAVLLERQERPEDAYKVARRLQLELERPVELEGRRVTVQVDVGIALHPQDGAGAEELHAAARRAMGGARQEQCHGIRFATAALNASTFERLALESNLRGALERGELMVYYQPRVEIASGRIVGFEALLRWRHPELGLVSPAQFVPLAEESGLIVPIGEWVLREACAQNQRWRESGLPHVCMAVNLSAVQFRRPELECHIAQALEEANLAAEGLELELTESMLLHRADETVERLRTIKAMGIRLAIDDFGTGYSSLSYIKRFPVDALKIDQSFIREVTTSAEDAAITTSIVLMGKGLDLTVVAEGVETRSQLEFLRVLECDEAQGYLFSRPVPAEEATRLLSSGLAR